MIRNLKALGLALVAVFAMSAMAASAASAATTDGEITVSAASNGTGTEIAGKANALTAFEEGVECPGSTYHIRKYNVTPHEPVPNMVTTVTAVPTYNQPNCKTKTGLKATVNMNGCDYVFHIGETLVANVSYAVTADIICPVGKTIDVEVYASASNENIKVCTLLVKPQVGLTGPALTNGTSGGKKDVTLEGTFKNIHVEETGLCGSKTTNTGEFDVAVTLTGKDAGGTATDVSISH